MRFFLLVLFGCGFLLPSRAESIADWTAAAPKADVSFSQWTGDAPGILDGGTVARPLAQGLYGYLDLSRLPAASFPLKLHLLYDPIDSYQVDLNAPGTLSQPKPATVAGSGAVKEETVIASANDAHAIPVWTGPAPLLGHMRVTTNQECARAEILGRDGTLLARMVIGASTYNTARPRALLVNTPTARATLIQSNFQNIVEATRLVPDSFALAGVDVLWIDKSTANDPALTDDYWRAVLLGGTKVVGLADDMAVIAKRLAITPDQPVLLGGLVTTGSTSSFDGNRYNQQVYSLEVHVDGSNPFAFTRKLAEMMHRQLLNFSIWYLVVFIVLQAVVVAGAFSVLRGADRVWIWLIIPGFALVYAVLGVVVSRGFVSDRSNSQLTQVELLREGWPQALLLTRLEQISLHEHRTSLALPAGSRPFIESSFASDVTSDPTSVFFHDASSTRLDYESSNSAETVADSRSIIPAHPPCALAGGKLVPARDFLGAWFWDGANWRDLGPLTSGQPVDWRNAKVIHPLTYEAQGEIISMSEDASFPAQLTPLLGASMTEKFTQVGDAIFLGAERVTDSPLVADRDGHSAARRAVAYQFHLGGGSP